MDSSTSSRRVTRLTLNHHNLHTCHATTPVGRRISALIGSASSFICDLSIGRPRLVHSWDVVCSSKLRASASRVEANETQAPVAGLAAGRPRPSLWPRVSCQSACLQLQMLGVWHLLASPPDCPAQLQRTNNSILSARHPPRMLERDEISL